ncbi:hypothetical protein GPECTOR_18g43 [Gonium pectorale]|uniref:Uncharacterized protein n=1 Tax=Gonium pectorale TaxID=33097 RepID=A0A150GJX5_GONPE|nr:hypothetical protein GPECTOR_18g43 [Gonium pectorale]|eukprot:KXZ50064.1 hypothetical protein GPECTOR_18g43 [Gonium pectorale]
MPRLLSAVERRPALVDDSRSIFAGASAAGRQAGGAASVSDGDQPARRRRPELRLPDGRRLVPVRVSTPAASTAGALSWALGSERRAVVRFDGAAGGLKGLRVLTLANQFMGQFGRAMSFVVDVRQVTYESLPRNELLNRPQAGDVSFAYRVMARSRAVEPEEAQLTAAMRTARFVLDLSISVRQAWDAKGDVDEEQAYDLADALYAALAAQQAEQDAEEAAAAATAAEAERRRQQQQRRGWARGPAAAAPQQQQQAPAAPAVLYVTTDLAQGVTTLTALALLTKRLREEGQQALAEATLYRASMAAPRLDGRDGWVFAIRLGFEDPYKPPVNTRYAGATAARAPAGPPRADDAAAVAAAAQRPEAAASL